MNTRDFHLANKLKNLWHRIRSSRASRNAAASYLAFVSTALWGLITIPIAVSFLSKEELGLWALINACLGYLMWMDLGVGGATGRMLADSVAKKDQDEINRWWTATRAVLIGQGCIVAIVGALMAPYLTHFFEIPALLRSEAHWIIACGAIITGLSFPMRGASGLLLAQERFHWVPLIQAITPWINLTVFYLLLSAGLGLKAYVWALAASQSVTWIIYYLLIRHAPGRPRMDASGLGRKRMVKLFTYSSNLSVIGLTETMMTSLPAIMIARLGNLSMVPMYNFSWKGPLLASGLVARTYHSFYPNLQQLYVSNKREQFKIKHEEVGKITIGISLMVAACILGGNQSTVHLLAGDEFYIGPFANLWFALAMVTIPLSGYFRILMPISGNLGKNALVSICKVLFALGLGTALWLKYGMAGIAATFAIAPIFNGIYGYFRGTKNCGFRHHEISSNIAVLAIVSAFMVVAIGTIIANLPQINPTSILLQGRLRIPGWQLLLLALFPFAFGCILFCKGLRQFFPEKT